MSCLECGGWLSHYTQWLCDKCEDKYIKIGKKVEQELKEKGNKNAKV